MQAGELLDRILRERDEQVAELRKRIEALERVVASQVREAVPEKDVLRWREVIERTGLSRATLSREIRAGRFPAPADLSMGRQGFRTAEVLEWLAGQRSWGQAREKGTTGASSAPKRVLRR